LVQHSALGFVIAFGAGIASFVSPCVLPLVPSYLSMMSGVGVRTGPDGAGAGVDGAERARLLWSTLLFVAGFSFVFAVLEATASALSHPLQAHKLVLSDVAGALIVAMGVVIAFQLPWLQREHRFAVRPSRLGPWAAPVMGMTFAFGWTPCITPVLAAVLGLASSGGTLARGEEMLVAYSFGLGVPFVLTGLAFGRLSGALGFARRHSRAVSLVSGALLAALGVLIITGEVGVVSSWTNSLLDHIGLSALASG
jgi:cytochrome c-type biogenesis protein